MWCNVYAQTRADGSRPAWDYVDALPEGEQKPIIALIQRIATNGPVGNEQKFKRLHGQAQGVWQLRSYQHRILCFWGRNEADGRPTIILTNAFRKKKQRTPPTEIQRALDGKARYEEGRQSDAGETSHRGED